MVDKAKKMRGDYCVLELLSILAICVIAILLATVKASDVQIGIIRIDADVIATFWSGMIILAGAVISFLLLREKTYYLQTGRHYALDHWQYQRSWSELLQYYKGADPYAMSEDDLPEVNWKDTDGVILGKTEDGKLIKRESNGVGNLACFALPGAGKTTSQIITTALRFGGSVLAIDIKGDIYNATHHERCIKLFDPEHEHSSCHFNPLYGVDRMTIEERCLFLESLAITLIPEEGEKARYWVDGGRDFFCGIAMYMLEQNINVTFPEIVNQIIIGNYADWVVTIRESNCIEAKKRTDSYFGTNEANVAGAYGTAVKRLRPLVTGSLGRLLDGKGECITPRDLDEGRDVYIEIPQEKIEVYAPVTTMIVQVFMDAFMQRADKSSGKDTIPIIFLLDEFHQLNFDLNMITTAMATLRSKNVSLFIAQQSIAQLESRYGSAGTRQIIDCCAYISVMSAQDPESREFFSKLIGTMKVLKVTTSGNRGLVRDKGNRTVQEEREPIFFPADFGNLGDDVVIYANGKYIRAEKTYYFE